MPKTMKHGFIKGKVSIIVPVYNAAKYLTQCLDSIFAQTYNNFELICVNDGSTDESRNIITDYLRDHTNIKVIDKEHSNAGEARNIGIKAADGEYITFWDADELYYTDYLSDAIHALDITGSDAVIMGANYFYDEDKDALFDASWMLEESIVGDAEFFDVADMSDVILNVTSCSPWNKVFRLKCILDNDLCFQSINRANDVLFISSALMCCVRVAFVREKSVAHRDHSESLQGTDTGAGLESYQALLAVKSFIDSRDGFEKFLTSFSRMAYRFIDDKIWNAKNTEICEILLKEYPEMKSKLELREECFCDYGDYYFGIRHRLLSSESIDVKSKPECIRLIRDVFSAFLEQKNVLSNYQRSYDRLLEDFVELRKKKIWTVPYQKLGDAKNIVIYGAGDIGHDLCMQLLNNSSYNLVALIDKNYKVIGNVCEIAINKVDVLRNLDFDCLIVAIRDTNIQEDVVSELTNEYKVAKEKIVCY